MHQPGLITQSSRRRRATETAGIFSGDNIAARMTHENLVLNTGKFPPNHTVVFSCNNKAIDCYTINFTIYNWNVINNAAVQAVIEMPVNLNEINKILLEPFEYFIIQNLVTVNVNSSGEG